MCKSDDLAAISHLIEDYVTAVNAGDASAVSAVFTDNAVLMPSDGSVIVGGAAIRSWYEAFFQQFTDKMTVSPSEEVEIIGDWAFSRGSWQATVTPKAGGEPVQASGKGLIIDKRQGDGSWKWARVIYTADKLFLPPSG